MSYLYVKAFHIIFVVCWFAGLFYIVRLFIYAKEASHKQEPDRIILINQLLIMQKKLWYIITWPAAILTAFFGLWMLFLNPIILTLPWMLLKIAFLVGLYFYHLKCHFYFKQQQQMIFTKSSFQLRLFNELATVLLISIVILVVVKPINNLIWQTVCFALITAMLFLFVYLYKKRREKS